MEKIDAKLVIESGSHVARGSEEGSIANNKTVAMTNACFLTAITVAVLFHSIFITVFFYL